MLANIPEWCRQSFSSYAETDRSRLSSTHAITNRNDEISFRIGWTPHSDFLEKNPVCLARYRSKYTKRTTADQIDVSLDKANDLGDEDMLHEIRGCDNKCTDMVADYCQYHRVSMNSHLTGRVHSQEKACPSTVIPLYNAMVGVHDIKARYK